MNARSAGIAAALLALLLGACSGNERPAENPASGADAAGNPPATVPVPAPAPVGVADPIAAVVPENERGSIEGHVTLIGRPPGNQVIRMGVDPKCAQLNRGKLTVDEVVAATRDGDLANVFVYLDGDLPEFPLPAETVTIEQRDCVYVPRVVGARAGQLVEVRNDDDLLHNVHAFSGSGSGFNVSQPAAGMVHGFQPAGAEVMLRLGCDVHRWMTAYIGVVDHPYFTVTPADGAFRIEGVPSGTYEVRAWHEMYGELSQTVDVQAGEVAEIEFSYAAPAE